MANTHHCRKKKSALALARRLRKYGNKASVNKTKKGYSVSAWK